MVLYCVRCHSGDLLFSVNGTVKQLFINGGYFPRCTDRKTRPYYFAVDMEDVEIVLNFLDHESPPFSGEEA
jgi:hypothetical protein